MSVLVLVSVCICSREFSPFFFTQEKLSIIIIKTDHRIIYRFIASLLYTAMCLIGPTIKTNCVYTPRIRAAVLTNS